MKRLRGPSAGWRKLLKAGEADIAAGSSSSDQVLEPPDVCHRYLYRPEEVP